MRMLLASIVESSDDAILSKDLSGMIRTWNEGAVRLYGYSKEEAVGKSIALIIPEKRRGEEVEILAQIRRGERVEHYETDRRRKDGSLVPISLTVSPVKNAEGGIIGASATARDITERQRAERRISDLSAQRDEMRRKMIATVSHELRTPISVIRSAAEALRRDGKGDAKEGQRLLRIIERHAARLTSLVEDILIDAEHQSGGSEPKSTVISLPRFIERFVEDITPLAARKEVLIGVDLHEPIDVRMDMDHLTRIFQNLLDNAIKYNKRNGTVLVRARRIGGREAQVSILDTGIGIDQRDIPLIFQQFYRSRRARAFSIQGTGLGLSILKTLVESNGGRIWAESVKKKGSTFHFTLPLATEGTHG